MEIQRTPAMVAGKAQGYAKGTAVTGARGFAFLSGAVGIDPDTGIVPERMGEQAKIAMEHSMEIRSNQTGKYCLERRIQFLLKALEAP